MARRSSPIIGLAVLAALALLLGSAAAWKRTAVVIFGDSLSDNGNFARFVNFSAPRSPPYFKGQFTTAPGVWGDQLPKYVKTPLLTPNFAFGGATACRYDFVPPAFAQLPTAETMARQYLAASRNGTLARALRGYTAVPWFWLGANDVQYLSFLPQDRVLSAALQLPTNISTCLTNAARLLLDNGHKYVVISTAAPFELTPLAIRTGTSPQATQIVGLINSAIRAGVARLQAAYPKATILLNNAHDDIASAAQNHTAYGFKFGPPNSCFNVTVDFAASSGQLPSSVCSNPDQYVFVDNLHPSGAGHRVMVRSALKTLVESKLIGWGNTRKVTITK